MERNTTPPSQSGGIEPDPQDRDTPDSLPIALRSDQMQTNPSQPPCDSPATELRIRDNFSQTDLIPSTTAIQYDGGLDTRWCIDLSEIEQRLYRHPAIAKATVFCYVDDQSVKKFGAAIQLHDWVQRVVVSEIKQWLLKHLEPEKVPERIIWIDS